jgi:GNAT superfamily N-acetyltransferase
MGWITACLVDRTVQRQGVGSQLIAGAEAYLRQKGRTTVEFSSYAPSYVVPGVDAEAYPGANAFFSSLGYRILYSCVAMDRSLVDYTMPEAVEALIAEREREGVVFERITPRYYLPLIEFCEREFYGDWTRAVREALVRQVSSYQIQICREGERILGFTLFGAYDRSFDRFGPFGVAESERGRGLGKALLHLTLQEQKRQQCHASWFLWTGEKSPAGYLYRGAGFEVSRRFDILQKKLGS